MRTHLLTRIATRGPIVAVFFVACATPPQPKWSEAKRAEIHRERAAEHDRALISRTELRGPTWYECGDLVLQDQLTSGTERIALRMPCWDPDDEAGMSRRELLLGPRARELETSRVSGPAMVEAERRACQKIPDSERDHSAFDHRKSIVEVIPHYEGTSIRGARVMFARIPGLTEDWLRDDIACHQARFQRLGKPPHLRSDPSLVEDATVSVGTAGDQFVVLITTETDEAGQEVLARARALLSSRTATR